MAWDGRTGRDLYVRCQRREPNELLTVRFIVVVASIAAPRINYTMPVATSRHKLGMQIAALIMFLGLYRLVADHRTSEVIQSSHMGGWDAVFTIFSSDTNPRYLLMLPFAVQHWQNLGTRAVVLLTGNRAAYGEGAGAQVLAELERLNVSFVRCHATLYY